MALDSADSRLDLADRYAVPEHCGMIVGHCLAQRSQAGGEVVELTAVSGYGFIEPRHRAAEPSHIGRELVELAAMTGDGMGDLRQQFINGCDIGAIGAAHR